MKSIISRRGFGKTVGVSVIGGLMAHPGTALASPPPATASPKRMTTVMRELISSCSARLPGEHRGEEKMPA